MAQIVQNLIGRVTILECGDRQEMFDESGGGTITRVIYCEPYSAHKRVLTALKGTVYPTNAAAPNAENTQWLRAKPHNDPLYPWFYCALAEVYPLSKSMISGSPSKKFLNNPAADHAYLGQFTAIQNALNVVDDFDNSGLIDNLTPSEIIDGGARVIANPSTQTLNSGEEVRTDSYNSRGYCGCWIIATYKPLIFQQGLPQGTSEGNPNAVDPFDFVDPQWEPITITTQLGRDLFFYSPVKSFIGQQTASASALHTGLTDTYAHPEVQWQFSLRRLMVPFLPKNTIGAFTNKLNEKIVRIGNLSFPNETMRMQDPEVQIKRAPDGQIYYDLRLKFLVRTLYDEFWKPTGERFAKGWIGHNHQLGIPNHSFAVDALNSNWVPIMSYYPVCWNSGLFQYYGPNHPLFLHDSDVDMGLIANSGTLLQSLVGAPFQAGFYIGQ